MAAENTFRRDHGGFDELLEIESQKRRNTAATLILISGGFDPLHIGHVALIRECAPYGRVVVALNSDQWLINKKGYVFMPWEERSEVLLALKFVFKVMAVDDANGSVAEAILRMEPAYFANGGDRKEPNLHEAAACKRVGCKQLFGIGGLKIQSSSDLVRRRME